MSRALEKDDLIASIQSQKEASQNIYQDLTNILTLPRNSLLEIEFLPKSHTLPPGQNFVIEDTSLAIPKKNLVQAFIIARKLLFPSIQPSEQEENRDDELLKATYIILLLDAEHLTAANTRKKIIKSKIEREPQNKEGIWNQELGFINTLLTARLHRHTKSPTLWSHRRWLLSLYRTFQSEMDHRYDILDDFKTVILVAAERHPKNYYAWSHARWLVEKFSSDEEENERIMEKLLPLVQDWALRHPSDISGFSFLFFCLSKQGSEARMRVYKQVLHLAISFKWTNESVWIYLRTLAAFDADVGEGFEDKVAGHVNSQSATEDSKGQLTLRGALTWYKENNQNKNPVT